MSFPQAFLRTVIAILADNGPFMPAIAGVVVYVALYPLPYLPQSVREIPVVVADADDSPLSREITRNIDATSEVTVTSVTRGVDEALPDLKSGRIGGIVFIPENFDRDLRRDTPTGITIMGNGGFIALDSALLTAARKATSETLAPALAASLVRRGVAPSSPQAIHPAPLLVKQPLFNTVAGYESYVVAASMGLVIMQLLTIAIAMVVGTWSENGDWPVSHDGKPSLPAYLGMICGFSAFPFIGAIFWSGFVFWYHDLPRAGNVAGFVGFAALYAVAIAAFAVSLGAWMADRERALQFVAAASIPLLFFSGFALPVESFTGPVWLVSSLFPSTPGIRGFIALNQMGAHIREVLAPVIHLGVLAAAFLLAGWLLSSRRARGGLGDKRILRAGS